MPFTYYIFVDTTDTGIGIKNETIQFNRARRSEAGYWGSTVQTKGSTTARWVAATLF